MSGAAAPSRVAVAAATLAALAAFVALDLAASGPVSPFEAPPPVAFGSGLAPSGAHCAAPLAPIKVDAPPAG
jgi:hypothetical protein